MANRKDVKTSSSIPTKKKGKGFSAENVMMAGTGIPKQEEFSGHILAGNVPKKDSKYKYGVTGDRLGHKQRGGQLGLATLGFASTLISKKSKSKKKPKRSTPTFPKSRKQSKSSKRKKKRTQEGGQILAGIIASVVVPELIKFVGSKISKALKKKKPKKKKKKKKN